MVLLSASAAIVGPTQAQTSNLGNTSAGATENLEKNFSSNKTINLTCRNDVCEPDIGEDVYNCPEDCGVCGDDICDTTEDGENCMEDCLCQGELEADFATNPSSPTWLDNTTLNASESGPHPDCLSFDWEGDDGIDKEADQGDPILYHNFTSATAQDADNYPPDSNVVEDKCYPFHRPNVLPPPNCGYVVTLEVEDAFSGETASVTKRIDVGGKGDPYPVLEVGSEPKIKEYPITFDASSSYDTTGPDGGTGEIVQYDYDWGHDDEQCIDCGETLTHEFPSVGEYDVQLNVTDDDDQWRTVTTEVDIDPNQPPEGELEATPDQTPEGKIVPGEDITFDATDFEDPEDQGTATPTLGIGSYDWDLDNDGTFEIIDGDVTERGSFDDDDAGPNGGCVTVRVSDTRGESTTEEECFDVYTSHIEWVEIKKHGCMPCEVDNPEIEIKGVSVFTEDGSKQYAVRIAGGGEYMPFYLPCNGIHSPSTDDDCENHPDESLPSGSARLAEESYWGNANTKGTQIYRDWWTNDGPGKWGTVGDYRWFELINDDIGPGNAETLDRCFIDMSSLGHGETDTFHCDGIT